MDVDRLGQVIINLLSNARKYSSPGSAIRMMLRQRQDECVISVCDTGVGISAEVLPYIFERFYRVPDIEVQTGSSIGLGLGLYISNQIVVRHGGHIDVQSTPGKGSIFSVVLPLAMQVIEPVQTIPPPHTQML